eukprot:scaffold8013_cov139-Amphora_coffeaeformis.AAC.2
MSLRASFEEDGGGNPSVTGKGNLTAPLVSKLPFCTVQVKRGCRSAMPRACHWWTKSCIVYGACPLRVMATATKDGFHGVSDNMEKCPIAVIYTSRTDPKRRTRRR